MNQCNCEPWFSLEMSGLHGIFWYSFLGVLRYVVLGIHTVSILYPYGIKYPDLLEYQVLWGETGSDIVLIRYGYKTDTLLILDQY